MEAVGVASETMVTVIWCAGCSFLKVKAMASIDGFDRSLEGKSHT